MRLPPFDKQAPFSDAVPINFGGALLALRMGKKVARVGWNGKGMWLVLVARDQWSAVGDEGCMSHLPWIGMKTADNGFVPWLASQTDILACDWVLVS